MPSCFAKLFSEFVIVEAVLNCLCNGARILGFGEDSSLIVKNRFGCATGSRGDCRHPKGRRFKDRKAEAFHARREVATREKKKIRARIDIGELPGIECAREVERDAQFAGPSQKLSCKGRVAGGAHDSVTHLSAEIVRELRDGFHREVQSLAWVHPGDREQIKDAAGTAKVVGGYLGGVIGGCEACEAAICRTGNFEDLVFHPRNNVFQHVANKVGNDADAIRLAAELDQALTSMGQRGEVAQLRTVKGKDEAGGRGKGEKVRIEPEANGPGLWEVEACIRPIKGFAPEFTPEPEAVGPVLVSAEPKAVESKEFGSLSTHERAKGRPDIHLQSLGHSRTGHFLHVRGNATTGRRKLVREDQDLTRERACHGDLPCAGQNGF